MCLSLRTFSHFVGKFGSLEVMESIRVPEMISRKDVVAQFHIHGTLQVTVALAVLRPPLEKRLVITRLHVLLQVVDVARLVEQPPILA